MLKLLHIENIAVIESCDIEFKNGFNVLTGETGAGKSIIIDSIGAVLGYRTTRDIVRNGASKASVTAIFDDCPEAGKKWLSDNGLDTSEEEIMISREISVDGKNSARINGKPVTAALMREFGIMLINVLGQHDSQQLLDVNSHAFFIDRFAAGERYSELESSYKKVFSLLQEKKQELKRLDIDEAAKARQVEMLKFQIAELEAAELEADEDTCLLEQQKLIRESAKLTERISKVYEAFSGENSDVGICSALSDSSRLLASVSGDSEIVSKLSDEVSQLYYQSDDVMEQLREFLEKLDFSDEDADRVEARLDVIHKLKRKYGSSVSEMLNFLENARKELSEIEFSEERISVLQSEIEKYQKEAYQLAEGLFDLRETAARNIEKRIVSELSELDMKNARFIVNIQKGESLTERGLDTVEFLLAANLGEAEKPLDKIASGGELSRIMLAMKNALDDSDYVTTLIFDEIDTGVSGRAAQKIAEKLYLLSVKKQVICVTHLAQLSAMSDIHFKIEKHEKGGRTYTVVLPLDDEGRASEIARITGGTTISETTLNNARELLSLADGRKKVIRNQM